MIGTTISSSKSISSLRREASNTGWWIGGFVVESVKIGGGSGIIVEIYETGCGEFKIGGDKVVIRKEAIVCGWDVGGTTKDWERLIIGSLMILVKISCLVWT